MNELPGFKLAYPNSTSGGGTYFPTPALALPPTNQTRHEFAYQIAQRTREWAGLPLEAYRPGIIINWPRYPHLTPGGKLSLSKLADKPVPWLSANVVNNLPRHLHQTIKMMWRSEAERTAKACGFKYTGTYPALLEIELTRPRGHGLDACAILEGIKPILDGMVLAGVIPDDDQAHIKGGTAVGRKGPHSVTIRLVPAQS